MNGESLNYSSRMDGYVDSGFWLESDNIDCLDPVGPRHVVVNARTTGPQDRGNS